ncbi:EAL domain-containing response regulator [Nitrosomonas sp.]|uniref:EAL domain-containing response regulator n=1 Tax=Nitrosomonas sp. TaxID=42353 RepID=UPI0028405E1A|nr:EAL domain-containing response regulator [Nitrosomonas sp.]MCP5244035.1 EAL domain-containing response regulator [Burkholderiales bacterium]MCP5291597.1 EAL domain-containing response regulator [Burkholderiales bacterium]MDR4514295.1 EAL domain-containing response regulator [Nitrosomonas sp.]
MHSAPEIKILLVDDDTFMLKILTKMLNNLGYASVSACDNGTDALTRIGQADTRPDLILLDLNMPNMDGIEFVRYLVERHFPGSLILVSGEDERMLKTAEKLVHAHQIPMLGYLHKPVSPDKLSEIINKWTPPEKQLQQESEKKAYNAPALKSAISNRELVNFYQPKVAVATGKVIGAETLVRWQHPTDGLVMPGQFIGIAEQNGLINDLTCLVLEQALLQARIWQENGIVLRVATNVSMDNLTSLDFQDLVVNLAIENGLSPQNIVLEVTESQLMDTDSRVPLEILTRLRLKRFHLSIDDFGTGHSSMAQLRDIPFDELKIDQSFVHRAWADETLRAMYDASLSMAKQLGMEVVAEGVADADDWAFLRRTGCDFAQGNFISKPLKAEDFEPWMQDWENRVHNGLIANSA